MELTSNNNCIGMYYNHANFQSSIVIFICPQEITLKMQQNIQIQIEMLSYHDNNTFLNQDYIIIILIVSKDMICSV